MSRRATRIAILVLLVVIAGCVGQDRQDTVTKCVGRGLNPAWGLAQLDVDVSTPDRCPFPIASGLTQEQEFVGIVTGNNQYIGSIGYVGFNELSVLFVRVFNWRSQLVNKGGTTPIFSFEGQPPRAPPRVTYTAGTAGYKNLFDTQGQDDGVMDVKFRDQTTVGQGFAKLTFTYTVSAVISGPISAVANSGFSLTTSRSSNYRTPLTYKWWKNGVLLSGVNWSGFTTYAPPVGTTATYKVEITDADGDKGFDTHAISGTTSSSGGGGGGGGCLRLNADSGTVPEYFPLSDSSRVNALPCPDPNSASNLPAPESEVGGSQAPNS